MVSPPRESTRAVERRRHRSRRATVAVCLHVLSAALVLVAVVLSVDVGLIVAAVAAVLLGALATRITRLDVAAVRREAALDRAAQASAYRLLAEGRLAESADFTAAMTERLEERDRTVRQLEGHIANVEKRLHAAEERINREVRRTNDARLLVTRMRTRLEGSHVGERDDLAVLSAWEAEPHSVEALVHWEEQARISGEGTGRRKRA